MSRLNAILVWAAVLWAPLVADASSGVCAEGATLDPLALVVEAPSGSLEEADKNTVAPQAPAGEVLWCVSPDDPRCAPLPADAPSQTVETRTPIHAVSEATTPRHGGPLRASAKHAHTGLRPRAGVRERLERPPREGRRVDRGRAHAQRVA